MESHSLLFGGALGYLLIFLGMLFEGDIILFTTAFLAHRGFFDIGVLLPVAFSGAVVGDVLWYGVGVWLDDKGSFLARWTKRATAMFDRHLHERPLRSVFISKFTYGLHRPVLLRIGMLKVSLKRFFKIDILAILLWMTAVAGLGYFSSLSFIFLRRRLRYFEFGLLISIVLFLFIEYVVRTQSRKRL